MKGVSKVKGPSHPKIGETNFYEVEEFYKGTVVTNPGSIKWKLYQFKNSAWIEVSGPVKTGKRVTYSFPQKWYGKKLLIEAYVYEPEVKVNPGHVVQPILGDKKITKTEILNSEGGKLTEKPKYGQSVLLRVTTENMPGDTLKLSLWERDTYSDKGHDPNNNTRLWQGEVKVLKNNGLAEKKINLTPDLMRLANKGYIYEGGEHEYYLLVEASKMKTISQTAQVQNKEIVLSGNTPAQKPASKTTPNPASKPGAKPAAPAEPTITEQVTVFVKNILSWDPFNMRGTSKAVVDGKDKDKNKTCVCKQTDLVWGGHPNVTCDFRKKVIAISKRQNFDPNHLMAVMNVETAGTFSPSKIELKTIGYNSKGKPIKGYAALTQEEIKAKSENFSGAVGLIQFTPVAIDELNNFYGYKLTKKKLAQMSQLDQLDYVEKYIEYWKNANKIKTKLTLADLYMVIFSPGKVNGSDDSTTLYKEGTKYYEANASLDTDKEDGITKKELAHRAYKSFTEGSKKANKASVFSCGAAAEEKKETPSTDGVLTEMKTLADSHKTYLQETDKNRTADTDAGLKAMDCSEFVSRYLHKLGVTKNIVYITTASMTNEKVFRKALNSEDIDLVADSKLSTFKPQRGDIFAWGYSNGKSWSGHTGVVYEYNETEDTVTILESIGSSGAVGEKAQVKNGGYSGKGCTRTAIYGRLDGALSGHKGWFGYYRPKNYTKKL